jgi:hypothetical protein
MVLTARPAGADILVSVSKTSQRMMVLIDGTARYTWLVSTGSTRHTTPSGVYKPQWLAKKWRSKQYGGAPMPNSIFFHKGYAIHGTTDIKRLGKIASHGCVRLHPDHAATLYSLVQNQMANTRLVVSDDIIELPGEAPKKRPSLHVAENGGSEEPDDFGVKLEAVALAPQNSGIELATEAFAMQNSDVTEDLPRAEKTRVVRTRDTVKPPRPSHTVKVARVSKVGFHW